jgi:hypothetical protein
MLPTTRPVSNRILPQSPPYDAAAASVTVIPPFAPGDGRTRVEHTLYAVPLARRGCCDDDCCCKPPTHMGGVVKPRHPEIVHFNPMMWVDGDLLHTTAEHREPPHDRYEEDLLPMVRLKNGKLVRTSGGALANRNMRSVPCYHFLLFSHLSHGLVIRPCSGGRRRQHRVASPRIHLPPDGDVENHVGFLHRYPHHLLGLGVAHADQFRIAGQVR